MTQDAKTEGIHQRVTAIALIEINLTGDGRQTDAVAIVGDAGDYSRKEASIGLGLLRVPLDGAEAE